MRLVFDLKVVPVSLAVAQEGAVPIQIQFLGQEQEQLLVVLEVQRKLNQKLAHAVQILDEYRRPLLLFVAAVEVAEAQVKLVAERYPVLGDQHNKTLQGSIIRVQKLLG